MKNILFLSLIVMCQTVFGQHKIAQNVQELLTKKTQFNHFSIFDIDSNASDAAVNEVVKSSTLAHLKLATINNILANKYEYLTIDVPFQNKIVEIQLYKVNPFAEGFHVDTDKNVNTNYEKGAYYRGIVQNDFTSVVSFNFFKDECNGIISSDNLDNLVIGKLEKMNNVLDYIIYKDSDLKVLNNFKCHTKEEPINISEKKNKTAFNPESTRCVTIYFEIDNTLFLLNNSDVTLTTNWMTSVFNNVQTLFSNDGITIAIKSIYVWTSPDPYQGVGTLPSDYLDKFKEVRPVFDGDLGQLVGKDTGLGGIAVGITGLCTNFNFSYSDVDLFYSSVPTYSWTVEVITHELGHLMGSPHTHGCYWNGNNTAIDGCATTFNIGYAEGTCAIGPIPTNAVKGTIMSYCHLLNTVGIKLSNGFGPQPAARILNLINNSSCLSTDCTTVCINNITTSNVINITENAATLTWIEQGGGASSQVAVYPVGGSIGTFTTPTNNSFTTNGLLPNTYYKAIVRNNCSAGLIGPEITKIFVTAGDFCSGISLTDSGGTANDYLDNEVTTRIIIPADPLAKATLTFTSFDLELDYDFLQVYDGHNNTFQKFGGTKGFSGNTIPTPLTSTAADGALTITFTADSGIVAPGYEASISCVNNLNNSSFVAGIDFTYYPNPTKNLVTINSKNEISDILVYNIAGQLLFSKKINSSLTNIDLSEFAVGTYFFKVKANNQEANFKIFKL